MQGTHQASRFEKLLRRNDVKQVKRTTRPFVSCRNQSAVLDRPTASSTVIVNPRPRFSPIVREDQRVRSSSLLCELETLTTALEAQIDELENMKVSEFLCIVARQHPHMLSLYWTCPLFRIQSESSRPRTRGPMRPARKRREQWWCPTAMPPWSPDGKVLAPCLWIGRSYQRGKCLSVPIENQST